MLKHSVELCCIRQSFLIFHGSFFLAFPTNLSCNSQESPTRSPQAQSWYGRPPFWHCGAPVFIFVFNFLFFEPLLHLLLFLSFLFLSFSFFFFFQSFRFNVILLLGVSHCSTHASFFVSMFMLFHSFRIFSPNLPKCKFFMKIIKQSYVLRPKSARPTAAHHLPSQLF